MSNLNNKQLQGIYYEISAYGKRTTIHGLSHIYATKDVRRRVFWCVTFALAFIATIIHLIFHTRQFLESPTVITLNHKAVYFEFPDVTLCSQTPTTGRFYLRDLPTYPNIDDGLTAHDFLLLPFLNVTYSEYRSLSYQKEIELHKRLLQHQLSSMPTRHKGMEQNEMIINCKYQGHDCKDQFSLIQDSYYMNCYTFKPHNRIQSSNNPEDGLVLLVYIGNTHIDMLKKKSVSRTTINASTRVDNKVNKSEETDWFARILIPGLEPAGIKIIINEKDAFPGTRSNGFIIGTGMFAELELNMVQEVALSKSYDPCTETMPQSELWTSVTDKGVPVFQSFTLELNDCINQAKQVHMFQQCGCLSQFLPRSNYRGILPTGSDTPRLCYNTSTLYHQLGVNFSKLNNQTAEYITNFGRNLLKSKSTNEHVQNFTKQVRCHDMMLREFSDVHFQIKHTCSDKVFSCVKNVYGNLHSSALWPRESNIQEVIEDHILPALLTNSTDKTKPKYKNMAHDIFNFDKNGNWETYPEIIRNNFVKLQLHPNEIKSDVHQEEFAYSVWEALGELGGIVGLWLGMSFLGVIEIGEFLLGVCTSVLKVSKKRSINTPEDSALIHHPESDTDRAHSGNGTVVRLDNTHV